MQLERYYACFPKDNIHVVVFEEMKRRPVEVYNDLFDFLGINPPEDWNHSFEKKHSSASKRRPSKVTQFLKQISLLNWIVEKLPDVVKNCALDILKRKHDIVRPMLSENTVQSLGEIFREDVGKLSELTGRKFEIWNLE